MLQTTINTTTGTTRITCQPVTARDCTGLTGTIHLELAATRWAVTVYGSGVPSGTVILTTEAAARTCYLQAVLSASHVPTTEQGPFVGGFVLGTKAVQL